MINLSLYHVASYDSIFAPGAKLLHQKMTQNRERNCVSTIGAPGVPTKRFVRREPPRLTSHKKLLHKKLQDEQHKKQKLGRRQKKYIKNNER